MVVEAPIGSEGVVYPVSHRVAQLVFGHASVDGQRGDQVDVVDTGLRGQVQYRLYDPLPDVGSPHRGQR